MYKFLHESMFSLHWNKSGIAGSDSISVFNLCEELPTVLQSFCTILHYHQQHMRVLIPPHPHQHLLFAFLIVAILVGVKVESHCGLDLDYSNC